MNDCHQNISTEFDIKGILHSAKNAGQNNVHVYIPRGFVWEDTDLK